VHPGGRELVWEKGIVPLTVPALLRNGTWLLPETSLTILWGLIPERSGDYLLLQKGSLPMIACTLPWRTGGDVFRLFRQEPGSDYWGTPGRNAAITFHFGKMKRMDHLAIAWLAGDTRKAVFAIELSADGKTFHEVWKGESSGKTAKLETYRFPMQEAAAVRLKLSGNSENEWNSKHIAVNR